MVRRTGRASRQFLSGDLSRQPRPNAIIESGGSASECGWCKDKFGLSWQITPRRLTEYFNEGGERGKRAFEAMMTMKKIDIAALDAAAAGAPVRRATD